ncbi:hypothetical protein AB840_00100 [Megasphaera cerevisiae DSM 20462]|uniref:Purine nucleoside phosphorylase n=1 Tax=Megasphaera cerevisiae DSM 20462 TaxID=1122219 RepID=A0A0J6WZY5_9FIRM|nr:peptidoglycan editing factor PgeF [Megasphaera cerevisiae]KMO87833.1 hypothetical protein AB840_00100 [Megasphaera cerevisiae DSM 20462]SJZ50585.1 conserved hypothetical protein [Megasphaera cerevisiae DSM 20462]
MLETKNGITFATFDILNKTGTVTAAVSARTGGISRPPFDSLNMSFSSGDVPEHIRENRKRCLEALGIDPVRIISCNQVHGIHIEAVGKDDCGRGALNRQEAIADCDGLMTHEVGVPLTMNFADCTPLLFYDPVRRVIALSHGGWRGAARNIGAVTLKNMHDAYGTKPADVLAAIGPTIHDCCFEVGGDVLQAFSTVLPEAEVRRLSRDKENGKYYFDLPGANKALLLQTGILPEHLEDAGICTGCREELFYSYRKASWRKEKTGRHMAVMELKEYA